MEQDHPENDVPPILDEQAQQTVDKLDHIIEMGEQRSRENVKVRREMTHIRRTLDKIVDRMVQAPNPILGDPPKAPTGTRMKRGRS